MVQPSTGAAGLAPGSPVVRAANGNKCGVAALADDITYESASKSRHTPAFVCEYIEAAAAEGVSVTQT